MNLWASSEFADEYQDWLDGHLGSRRALWFDISVGQLERHPLLLVAPDTPVAEAIELMNHHDRGAVLIVCDDRLTGIFTERDVVRRVFPQRLDVARTPISAVMTHDPDTLDEHASLAQALRKMARARYRHLPVVDAEHRPLSVMSMRRIVQFVGEAFPEEILNAPPEWTRDSVLPTEGA